jgi:EAL domain-containing protein (putative c-di-GMP-specific phosphodiesterase class I)/GGDEF domain-containing protein
MAKGGYLEPSGFRGAGAGKKGVGVSKLYDPTTGLPQGELFDEVFGYAIKHNRRHDRILALARLAVAHRDRAEVGLSAECLQAAEIRIKNTIRENDLMGYLSGNEFVVVFNDLAAPGDADRAVQRLLADFDGSFDLNGRTVVLKARAGISLFPADGDTTNDLMAQAERARCELDTDTDMAYRFVSEDINRTACDRLALAQSMQEAVEQRQFQVFYLPQYDLVTETLAGVEALLKWQHPQLGLLPASRWVPLADELNTIQEITRFVLEQVSADDAAWQRNGARPVDLMINFCTSECLSPNFVKNIHQTIQAVGIPCRRLIFEFAEDCIGYHATDAWQSLTQLVRMGIRINLDNYGRGYTNVVQLKTWPLGRIKIDRTLIAGIVDDEQNRAAVRALVDLGHALKMKVAANGAETPDHLTVLKNMGCDLAQGFALAHPGDAAAIGELLRVPLRLG